MHIILRGGKNSTNYDIESIKKTCKILKSKEIDPKIVIDMSHGNSKKIHTNQILVCESVCNQIKNGEKNIIGVMVESNIKSGKQKLINKDELEWGVSITDACIDIKTTSKLVSYLYNALSVRFKKRKKYDI